MCKSVERKIAAGFITGSTVFLLLIFVTNLCHYHYRMNADTASEAILGEVIWNSGQIIPDTWYPSTETRIISTPDLAALFYGVTGNLVLSSGLACCMMTILILLAIWYFAKSVELGKTGKMLMVFLCLMIPSGFIMLELLYLFAGYYAIHTAALFATLAIYVSLIKRRNAAYKLSGGYFTCLPAGIAGRERNTGYLWSVVWDRIDQKQLLVLSEGNCREA